MLQKPANIYETEPSLEEDFSLPQITTTIPIQPNKYKDFKLSFTEWVKVWTCYIKETKDI